MDSLQELVISPFQEIVEKGQAAIDNAEGTQPMLKAAQSLAKEGERALHKLEPLCRKNLVDYGDGFVHAVRANDDISTFRAQLEDLLWDFDDYLNTNGFQLDKFSELQALSRKAAPKILDILRRMDLPRIGRSLDSSALSPPTSPLFTHSTSNKLSTQVPLSRGVTGEGDSSGLHESVDSGHGATDHISSTQDPVSSGWGHDSAAHLSGSPVPEPKEKPPCPPLANPWDLVSGPVPTHEGHQGNVEEIERRPAVAASGSESPVDPMSPLDLRPEVRSLSLDSEYVTNGETHDSDTTQPSFTPISYSIFPSHTSRPRPSTVSSVLEPSIPEDKPLEQTVTPENGTTHFTGHVNSPRSSRQHSYPSPLGISPIDTHNSHGQDDSHSSALNEMPSTNSTGDLLVNRPEKYRKPVPHKSAGIAPAGLEPVHPLEADYGPIPVESERPKSKPDVVFSSRDCVISPSSSFYLNKGFCEGAHQVLSGEIGVRQVKKPGFATAVTVARCTGCLYELDFKEIENDVNRLDVATDTLHGVAYRLRFLQKCHLPTKRIDDIMYGCIFCVHQGRTLDESDATVFFSPKSLLAHLARHPRQLPEIAGLRVIDEPEIPAEYANDFDLHFMNPPVPHPVRDLASGFGQQPSGVAKEQVRKLHGRRLLPDKSRAHEVAQGARLTGITWPPKYEGEWIFAWHDGIFASIPSNIIRLDAPQAGDVKLGGTSHVSAKARWKFAPKEKDRGDWLKFDKGEQISNICWQYFEQWFWTGTNAKGKWGVFPQAFIDNNTLQDTSAELDRTISLNREKNRSSSMFGRRFGTSAKKGGKNADTTRRRDSGGTTNSGYSRD